MAGAVEPPLDHFVGGLGTVGNVLSNQLLGVADCADAVGGRVPGQVVVLEVIMTGHVGSMSPRDVVQGAGQPHRRRGTEGALAAAGTARSDIVDKLQRTRGEG